jgi:tRNA threonylcarbamoyladenosine biosynthesis protein TsaB
VELSIDTASDWASIALSREGRAVAEMTWYSHRQHSTQLMPAIEALLSHFKAQRSAVAAVFVCLGPGSYAALRAGVSVAKGLAFAFSIPIVGVGRLELDAYPYAECGRPVCAVHRAGRGEAAWAVYEGPKERWSEVVAPRMSSVEEMLSAVSANALFCGEEDDRLGSLVAQAGEKGSGRALVTGRRRADYLAELGWRRLAAGRVDDARTLVPLYLREPAIGPQS